MTLGERVREIRKKLGYTQERFGTLIGMKRNSIAQIEGGRNTSEQTIFAICREFNVDETWLRTGEGEMFVEQTREKEIKDFVDRVLQGKPENFRIRLISALSRLDEDEWVTLEQFAKELVDTSSNTEIASEITPYVSGDAGRPRAAKDQQKMTDEELHAELDRQLLKEKKQVGG